MKHFTAPALEIRSPDGRTLIRIDLTTGEVTGELENMNEAAAVFVSYVRQHMPPPKIENVEMTETPVNWERKP